MLLDSSKFKGKKIGKHWLLEEMVIVVAEKEVK